MRAIGEIASRNAPGRGCAPGVRSSGKSTAAKLNGGVTEVTEWVHLPEIAAMFAPTE
ncbi:hypothetical protein V1277_006944 [Bradyrhizobium sp. AZCC 1588]